MNDAQDYLDRIAGDLASPLPAGLVDTARTARRRRTRGRVAVVGGVAAVVAVVGLAAPGGTGSVARRDPAATSPTTQPAPPGAPAGTRWIAQSGYMVALPEAWQQIDSLCEAGFTDLPGAYYFDRGDLADCVRGAFDATTAGLVPSAPYSVGQRLVCDPSCSRTVVRGPVELRLRGLPSAGAVAQIVDSLQPLPGTWSVDDRTGVTTPGPTPVPGSRLVTNPDDVVGEWSVIEVRSGPVPAGAETGLVVERLTEVDLRLGFSDGVNAIDRNVDVSPDGALSGGGLVTTDVGCVESCGRPSGFGVAEAVELRLTPDGDLVLVGPGGTSLAVYEPA